MAIGAHLEDSHNLMGQDRAPRRTLRLETHGATPSGATANVQVHNVSATGLLLESQVPLVAGEKIEIDLPHAGATWAKVVWASDNLFGCQFHTPISPATLSATQLRGVAGQEVETPTARPPVPDESFGYRLQRLRRQSGLTLSGVASRLGVSKPTVWAWEQDKSRPLDSRIEALADVLGVPVSELMPGLDTPGLRGVLARSRVEIANAVGVNLDQVRIMIEL